MRQSTSSAGIEQDGVSTAKDDNNEGELKDFYGNETHRSEKLLDRKGGQLAEEGQGGVQADGLLVLPVPMLLTLLLVSGRGLFSTIRSRCELLLGSDRNIAFSWVYEK